MDEAGQAVNWSAIAQQAFREVVLNLAVRKETATMDDAVERLRVSKRSYVEAEREAGLEVGEVWATEHPEYGELLRIAKAVAEARREIDVQTLQDLIDPEHKMDAGDWSDSGKIEASIANRAMGGTEPSQIVQRGSSRKPGSTSSEAVHAGRLD